MYIDHQFKCLNLKMHQILLGCLSLWDSHINQFELLWISIYFRYVSRFQSNSPVWKHLEMYMKLKCTLTYCEGKFQSLKLHIILLLGPWLV